MGAIRLVAILLLLVGILIPRYSHGATVVPNVALDTDHDGAPDSWETALNTDPTIADTDGDGFLDGQEIMAGYDPKDPAPHKLPKRIAVSLKDQKLTYYFGATKLEEFLISSGLSKTPTPPGNYTILEKRPVVRYKGVGFDFPNTKWNLRFKPHPKGGYYIHGAYWHNAFGKPRSHGCVNVAYANMERLYDWAEVGTPISIIQ